MEKFFGGLVKAAIKALILIFVLVAIVASIHWARNNQTQAQATGDSLIGAGAAGIQAAANGFTNFVGGSAGQAATAGPETIWVENKAPTGWHVRQAVLTWNKGLTTVKLRLGACHDGVQCIRVSQVKYLAPTKGQLTLGRTSHFLGTVRLNGDAIGKVPASFFQVAACHELGHALGAEHNPSKTSCMHATIGAGIPARPAAADYAAVNDEHR